MRKNILVPVFILVISCNAGLDTDRAPDFKRPAVVVAVAKHDSKTNTAGGIVLRDAKGDIYTYSTRSYFGIAMASSYNTGDTIK